MTQEAPALESPLLRIHQGEASPEDVAVLIALFSAMASHQAQESSIGLTSSWNSKDHMFRPFPTPGPGAWRSSGLPR